MIFFFFNDYNKIKKISNIKDKSFYFFNVDKLI